MFNFFVLISVAKLEKERDENGKGKKNNFLQKEPPVYGRYPSTGISFGLQPRI